MIEALTLQTTPALPAPSGGGTSPLAILTIAGIVAYFVQTRTSIDLLGLLPSLGGGSDGGTSSSSSGGGGSGGILGFVTSVNGIAIGVLTLLSALVIGGAIDLPRGTGVAVVVTLVLLASALILDELGGLSPRLFLSVVAATVLIALSATGEAVIASVVNSPVGPLAVLAGAAILWRALGDRTRKIVVRGEVEEGGEQ